MKPVLAKWPQPKRNVAFLPFAAGVFLFAFLVLAIATDQIFLTLVLAPPLAIAGAWALVGWPQVARKDGKPLVEPKVKPFLFFVLAPLFAILLYPLLGYPLTTLGFPLKFIAVASLVVSISLAVAGAYLLVGFPNLWGFARAQYALIPPERRPFLFFPLFVLFFLVLYLGVGVSSTEAVASASYRNVELLVVLPLCVILAALGAYFLVGFPKPTRNPKEYLPKVTGKHRPLYFGLTFLLAGIPFTYILGALLNAAAGLDSHSQALLPSELLLPLAVILGYTLSLGVAALVWGTPARWRRYDDYQPGLHPKARRPVQVSLSLAAGLLVVVIFGLSGLDIFWGLVAGTLVALLALVAITGVLATALRRRKEGGQVLPELPDGRKPLVLFPTWLAIAFLLFASLTYAFPQTVAWNALGAGFLGLVIALAVVELPLVRDLLEERRQERERRKAWKARRKERLAQEADEAKTQG